MRKRRFSLVAFLILVAPFGEGSSWTSFHARALRRTTQPNKSPPRSSLYLRRLVWQHSDVETNGSKMETILNLTIAQLWRLREISFLNPPFIIKRRVSFDSTGLLTTSCLGRMRRHQRCFGAAKRENEARLVNGYTVTPTGNDPDSSVSPAWCVGGGGSVRPEIPKWKHKAVIIPGFATDARAFEQLCHRLDRRGIASVVVPIRWYHWLPTLGGRSVRPILDRIHETVIRCVAADGHKQMPYAFNEPGLQSMVAPYTIQDFLSEMFEPRNGAHHMGPLDLPHVPQLTSVDDRVILIAHSAGGWMSRIYLSESRYDERVYNGSSLVNGLITLGTPHVRLEDDLGRPRELPFSRNFKVYQSYELCCGDGTGVGDGITPLESAFGMAGAKRFIQLEGIYHAAGLGGAWFGSDSVIDSWLEPSLEAIFGSASTEEATTTTAGIVPSEPLLITLDV